MEKIISRATTRVAPTKWVARGADSYGKFAEALCKPPLIGEVARQSRDGGVCAILPATVSGAGGGILIQV